MRRIWFWYSASSKMAVTFVRWHVMRMHTGGPDTNKLGVGAVVKSSWWFRPPLIVRRQRDGQPVGYALIRPYMTMYYMNNDGTYGHREFKRPSVKHVRQLQRRRR